MSESLKTERTSVRRLPSRGHYDRDQINTILDAGFLCHIAFVVNGAPFIIPTAYGRDGETLYIHGSAKSRMLNYFADGGEAALCITHMDGIVLARSLFHSSMNYRSVVLLCKGRLVAEHKEKEHAFRVITEHIMPGRWEEARQPNANEYKATHVVAFDISEGSAKIRTGGAKDDKEDYLTDLWAGVLNVKTIVTEVENDDKLKAGITIPESVQRYAKEHQP